MTSHLDLNPKAEKNNISNKKVTIKAVNSALWSLFYFYSRTNFMPNLVAEVAAFEPYLPYIVKLSIFTPIRSYSFNPASSPEK